MNENENAANVANYAASASQRFVSTVMREFTSSSGKMDITPYQESLIQGYFIACDKALRYLEEKRQKDAADGDKKAAQKLPYTWENINIGADLAQSIAIFAKNNLSILVKNHFYPIPRLNGKNGRYDLTFQEGYEGLKYKAVKYSLFEIVDFEAELLYSNDKFKIIKDCYNGSAYELEIANPFDRGNMIGGYAYIRFKDPRQNKLFTMSKAEIDAVKDTAQTQTFWKPFYNEMALKTVVRRATKLVILDPKKFDDYYLLMQKYNNDAAEADLANELREKANREPINVTPIETPPASIPEHAQPVQQMAEIPVPMQNEPAPQYAGVDMGKDVTQAQAEPIGPDIPDEFKLDF